MGDENLIFFYVTSFQLYVHSKNRQDKCHYSDLIDSWHQMPNARFIEFWVNSKYFFEMGSHFHLQEEEW